MAKAVLFYGTDFDVHQALPLPRHSGEFVFDDLSLCTTETEQAVQSSFAQIGQSWALLHEESPKNNMLFNHASLMGMFNYTSTFRQGSDLPLTLQYLEEPGSITGTELFPRGQKAQIIS